MQKLWQVAPPSTWLVLGLAATFLLAGFVLLSHSLVRHKAHGDTYTGLVHPGRLEWTVRTGAACLLAGFALWALQLGAPVWVTGGLAALGAAGFALEGVALTRR